ncbi:MULTISPECIES: heavy-metal-associated domain-containing protein [Methylococcus]|jgi:copper chaperone CopZ|uniref:Copper chaperone CopZ n=2 Tax=Methylococcus capsulatus TaxID=414 RepID=A0AA35XZP8_METCP|nr:heavy-metal-associated domain-containing protein [Methylococcus capsulatus]AAU93113.1 putative mercuric ion binding protein [Methylococcus capsulatus str. Bath]QXP88575.1 cation transporter [Methylococcus capsulatus]QXP90060.1 cation transporter [Methylococcus capsulatus]QXP94411.1 cation transporter [Methylococcus capsulatus]UQN10850.1 cation transporter [Methylococcus capsulatus]
MATIQLQVTGMKCGGCENTVVKTVAALAGVTSVTASHKENRVDVEYDPDRIDPDAIRKAIAGQGYTVA